MGRYIAIFCVYLFITVGCRLKTQPLFRFTTRGMYLGKKCQSPSYVSVGPSCFSLSIICRTVYAKLRGSRNLCRKPYDKPAKQPVHEANEVELITAYLEQQKMVVDTVLLIKIHHQDLARDVARSIYTHNKERYKSYAIKLRPPEKITGKALFNAFVLDCQRQLAKNPIIDYAPLPEN